MISYQKFGFVNTKNLFKKALKGGYAIPAYNFNNMEQLQAIVLACLETQTPVILQVSKGAREYADKNLLQYMALGAVEMMKCEARSRKLKQIPIVLHLDHGTDFDICKSCIDSGFSSVMIDGSRLSFQENIKLTKKVVQYAHRYHVTVEGELGVLAGKEESVMSNEHVYTCPEEAVDFVQKTGVDSLAVAIGTSHGAYKFKSGQKQEIRLDILNQIEKYLPGFPIVLHGSSSIPLEYVAMINQNGGQIEEAVGISENQLRTAAKGAVCKINIDSDGRLVMTGVIRKYLFEHPEDFDPRKYLGSAREALKEMYKRKNRVVFGAVRVV